MAGFSGAGASRVVKLQDCLGGPSPANLEGLGSPVFKGDVSRFRPDLRILRFDSILACEGPFLLLAVKMELDFVTTGWVLMTPYSRTQKSSLSSFVLRTVSPAFFNSRLKFVRNCW